MRVYEWTGTVTGGTWFVVHHFNGHGVYSPLANGKLCLAGGEVDHDDGTAAVTFLPLGRAVGRAADRAIRAVRGCPAYGQPSARSFGLLGGLGVGMFFEQSREWLRELGVPDRDPDTNTLVSGGTFADGRHWRFEAPTVNTVQAVETLLCESAKRGFTINRVTETFGLSRHTLGEICDYVALGREHGAQILMSVGPRAIYDIGATVQTQEGVRIGYRLRGQEQLVRALEDVQRAVEAGVRGFILHDEGLLSVLSRLRAAGKIPADTHLKISAHCGLGNGASAQVLERLGADSLNPVRDLTLPIIAALRQSVRIPLDVHVDNTKTSGGFIRTYEAPEFVRVASPVYLKTGSSALAGHSTRATQEQTEGMLRQMEITAEFMARHYPQACQSPAEAPTGSGTTPPSAAAPTMP
ncbi:peptidase [Streptomyces filipinensis]|uniref:peptidase n=2 Tax=Streptomyces TaxID=1883 RepID=UPI0036E258C6